MASAESRLRERRRHRETFALAVRLGVSLVQARRLLIQQHLDRRRRLSEPDPERAARDEGRTPFWWEKQ